MRLQPAAPRAHTAPPVPTTLRRRLANLLTLSLLGVPALAGQAAADEPVAAPAPIVEAAETPAAAAEGVVKLSDVRRTTTDGEVRPAGLLHCSDDPCEPGCEAPCAPACDGCVCDGGECDGSCGHGSCGPGSCLFGRGYGYGCPPGVACPGGIPVPCPSLLLPGLCPMGVPHMMGRCGGPESCYLCSLCGIGANANNGRHGLAGCYEHVYALDPSYVDRRTGNVWASQQTGVPMAVPLAPNVRHTMEYGWGMPSSRLVPISRPLPPSALYGPPAGTQVELPTSPAHPDAVRDLPLIPDFGQGHLPRTGTAFPRTTGNR